jgi:phosphoglycerate kinase
MPALAGRGMEEELRALNAALENPKRPVVAIVGGSKISTKLDVLTNLVEKVDALVIGGAMANTFLYAQGFAVGKSLCEKELKDTALSILKKAEEKNCKILLPDAVAVVKNISEDKTRREVPISGVAEDDIILDIGAESIKQVSDILGSAKTVIWNGPVGMFEKPPFDMGTIGIAKSIAKLTKDSGLISVAGGGDTVAALAAAGVMDSMTYVSTAGGAFLEWMEGKALPGVAALKQAAKNKAA